MALNNNITTRDSHSKQPPLRQITIMNTPPSNNDNDVDDSSPIVKHTHTASIASLTNVIAIDDAQEVRSNVMTPTPFASMDEDDTNNRTTIPMTPPPTRRDRGSAESSHLSTISMIMLSEDGHMPSLEDHYEYHNEVIQPTASSLVGEESPRDCQQRGRFLVWPSHASAAVTIDDIIPSSA